ncbi:hypothetical protein [Streptococcus cuniculi]|nr:hypothetical protein [Streptococcus cuniculi]
MIQTSLAISYKAGNFFRIDDLVTDNSVSYSLDMLTIIANF